MTHRIFRTCMAWMLAVQILFSQTPVLALAMEETYPTLEASEPTQVPETQPESTQVPETQPEPTQVPETQPEPTEVSATEPESTLPPETIPESPPQAELPGPKLYFGRLHGHTGTSDPAEVWSLAAREGLDFFALTDHSHSFQQGTWASGRTAAAAATTDTFLALYGYEISWPRQMRLGHISTVASEAPQSWKQPEYSDHKTALSHYYQALTADPASIGQFNHPGSQYGAFLDFAYSEEGDRMMALMELADADAWDFYVLALDRGWHLSPTMNESGRTGVWMEDLTEEELYEALRSRRTYATEDGDLRLMYTLDGHMMGSRLRTEDLGKTMTLSLAVSDGTDGVTGLAEVITTGGQPLASRTLEGIDGALDISLDTEPGWYLIRVTQPDGDQAVTAPVWIEGAAGGLGIESLTCETAVPEQHAEIRLTLNLYNREREDFLVESLTFFADGVPAGGWALEAIGAGETLALPVSLTLDEAGRTRITACLRGALAGESRQYEASLELLLRQSRQNRDILVDGSHGNQGLDSLGELEKLAAEAQVRLRICRDAITPEDLKAAGLFLVTAPSSPFSPEFLAMVSEHVAYGGGLAVCGRPGEDPVELNRLLEAAGATLRMEPGPESGVLSSQDMNPAADWYSAIQENQYFRGDTGLTIQGGTWLVKSPEAVLLAREEVSGGMVLACGSLFLQDSWLKPPKNIWSVPLANRTIAESMLGMLRTELPLRAISDAREAGTDVRLRGYVTAGTAKPGNEFPQTICVQDETGGIWAGPITEALSAGTAVELTGTVTDTGFLEVTGCRTLDAEAYLWPPKKGSWSGLLDLDVNRGRLIQVEGQCREIYSLKNGLVTGCLLEDGKGNRLRVRVEETIVSGADGENDLHLFIRKGRTIRAIGILHVDEYGDTELRVRNCDEVVYVPPRNPPPFNPPTGDNALALPLHALVASLLCLAHLPKRKKTSG